MHRSTLMQAIAGKGDETIKELNRLESIAVDPTLVVDNSFWDWALIPTEQNSMKLHTLPPPSDPLETSSCSSLVSCGGDLDDIDYYDLFHESTVALNPPSIQSLKRPSALIVSYPYYKQLVSRAAASEFDKVLLVRSGEGEEDDEGCDEKEEMNLRRPDIDVSSCGELRALTICSYALLTKKT